jgi:coatomer subunit epsilon
MDLDTGTKGASIETTRSLKAIAPEHPFLVEFQEKSVMFDKAAAKYSAKVA